MRENLDFYFHAECAVDAPRLVGLTEEEIRVMREIRWWSAEEIEASGERFFPVDIAERMRSLWSRMEANKA
jgi:hypothetical protein